jgi:LysR family transcriptional regulator, hydrogen peroxide-inducible genes activator
MLTDAGREIAGRATRILTETRNIVDFARRQDNTLFGPLQLGVFPSVALCCRRCRWSETGFPKSTLHFRKPRPIISSELLDGTPDLLSLALPVENPEIENIKLRRIMLLTSTKIRYVLCLMTNSVPDDLYFS